MFCQLDHSASDFSEEEEMIRRIATYIQYVGMMYRLLKDRNVPRKAKLVISKTGAKLGGKCMWKQGVDPDKISLWPKFVQLGVWGRCKPPQRGPGQSPGIKRIFGNNLLKIGGKSGLWRHMLVNMEAPISTMI